MPSVNLKIKNSLGLHARAASVFVKLSSKFASDICLQKGEQVVNGKSILGIMTLAAGKGAELVLSAAGDDSDQALKELSDLVKSGFGED
jgi:phosphocarrier protein HPr